jgi:hypothetical protein
MASSTATASARGRTAEPTLKRPRLSPPERCRRKFLRHFPGGFYGQKYLDWERGYKEAAHEEWRAQLGRAKFRALLDEKNFAEIAARAVRIESRTNLLFSFEKMALRDAVRDPAGARGFAEGLYDFLHGPGKPEQKFTRWCAAVAALPRRQTRVLTWPLVTVFGFIAQPDRHIFLKPHVTRVAAETYFGARPDAKPDATFAGRAQGSPFAYRSQPNWETYAGLLAFAEILQRDLADLRPRDMIDIQSFIWVLGSEEYG